MAFPATPLDMTIELFLNSAWTDVTSLIYRRDMLSVSRGRADESQHVERSVCKATANNRNGDFSSRNPSGQWYGQLGRNTPMRVRVVPATEAYMLKSRDSARANTPDSANLSITGDIEIRLDFEPNDVTVSAGLANKWLSTGNQRSWALYLNANGTISFAWSADGSATITKTSTAAISFPASGRKAVKVTLDVDNGAAGNDVKFFTADTISGSYSQLGATVTTGGVTSIFNSTANLEIGGSQGVGSSDDLFGKIYGFEMYQGIAGTIRSEVDFDNEEPGPGPFTDTQGNVWTLVDDASIVNPGIRFVGELSNLPVQWDPSGRDVYSSLEASGILRRLTQGASPLKSTLYRAMTSSTITPLAYWPCEDGEDSTGIASAIGGPPMTLIGTPDFASNSEFKCSEPLPTFSLSQWTGTIPSYTDTGLTQVWLLLKIPVGGTTDDQGIFRMHMTGGTIKFVDLMYHSGGGDLELRIIDNNDTEVANTTIDFNIDGKLIRVAVDLDQNGANFDWDVNVREQNSSFIAGAGATVNSQTLGRATKIVINPGANLDDIVVGHISVDNEIRSLFELAEQLDAYARETAGRRIERLCSEESITFRGIGFLDSTVKMGAQLPDELVNLLREAAFSDGGILYEPRDFLGLAFRTRESMYFQDPVLELDYSAKHLSDIEPVDDDQAVRNDITATRTGGSSFRAVRTDGPLSVDPPPDGVGRYDEQVTVSTAADDQLPDQAGWRLHLGSGIDEARYPTLAVELSRPVFVASSALTNAAQDLDIGDRLTVDNPPAWLPPDLITQICQGLTETMAQFEHRIEINCSPETPWAMVATYDSDARYSSDGSTLNEDLTTVETAVDVATPSGPLWGHNDGDFDIVVGGEVMTVTAVSGAGSPQTFTVTRSVNGVIKTHLTGAEVALARPAVYAI